MQLLSKEMELQLVDSLISQCSEKMLSMLEAYYVKPPYCKQKELMEELSIDHKYLKRLEAAGLKRVKLDPMDKTIFYKRADVYDLMDRLAE